MARKTKFAVTAPGFARDRRYIVSRHYTRAAADRATEGKIGFEVVDLVMEELDMRDRMARDLANWEI